jgi:nitrite reductase/ring-hydroxylating ferredoxin subunit
MEPVMPAVPAAVPAAASTASAAPSAIAVCASDALSDGGLAVRRDALFYGRQASVFFVRFRGAVHGYLNQCAHVPTEMDWVEGQFFESSGNYLMCAMHGAIYEPDTGRCVGGPCRGGRLRALRVEERDTAAGRQVFWLPDAHVTPAMTCDSTPATTSATPPATPSVSAADVTPDPQPSFPNQAPDHARSTDA